MRKCLHLVKCVYKVRAERPRSLARERKLLTFSADRKMIEERGKDGEEKGFKKKENPGSAWRRRSSQGRVAADLCLFVVLNVCADLFQALILQ